jgi:hypothetical protein
MLAQRLGLLISHLAVVGVSSPEALMQAVSDRLEEIFEYVAS